MNKFFEKDGTGGVGGNDGTGSVLDPAVFNGGPNAVRDIDKAGGAAVGFKLDNLFINGHKSLLK
ncbi:hypothetical protein [Eubacterium aggregans]|uniref:hypothetical protein n=1 Tax=Eubacterium aggregans TaxID=81409 RepID=UPI003F359A78